MSSEGEYSKKYENMDFHLQFQLSPENLALGIC